MAVLNGSLAGALGRPDLVFGVQRSGQLYGGDGLPVVIAGSSQSLANQTRWGGSTNDSGGGSVFGGDGRAALIVLMVLLGGYAAFTWWVRPHLA